MNISLRTCAQTTFLALLLACCDGAVPAAPPDRLLVSVGDTPACCAKKELAPAAPLPDRSLYQIESSWTNDTGVALRLADLRGKPVVVSMFFASCQFTCPVLVNDLKRIEALLPDAQRTNVNFLLVSFDSENDTPEVLARYRTLQHLGGNWTLLRGSPDDVLEFGNLLGIKFKKDPDGTFAHSNVISVLDREGVIVHRRLGLNGDAEGVVAALKQLKPAQHD